MPENTQIAPLDVPICSASFDSWWNYQENGCPTLVLDNDEQFARAVWNAAIKAAELAAWEKRDASGNIRPTYPPNVENFIQKWQPKEYPRSRTFWKEFRKAANAYADSKQND